MLLRMSEGLREIVGDLILVAPWEAPLGMWRPHRVCDPAKRDKR